MVRILAFVGADFDPSDYTGVPAFATALAAKPGRTKSKETGTVNLNAAPCPASDSTQMRPPWRSTTFLQSASPIPVPEAPCPFRLLNIPNIFSASVRSTPIPLSRTENNHLSPAITAEMLISGAASLRYRSEFPIRFWKTCTSITSSAITIGNEPAVTIAPLLRIGSSRFSRACASARLQSTGASASPLRSVTSQ